jgi:adenylate kinase family enzyme
MKLIVLRGYPGSGKSTLGRRLQKEGYGIFIDHNELLNQIVQFTGDDKGIYDDIVRLELSLVRKLLSEGKDVIVARGFSTEAGVSDYLQLAEEANAGHIVLHLDGPEELLGKRVLSPTRKDDYTPISTPEQLHEWTLEHPMEQISSEVKIDVAQPFDQMLREVEEAIGSKD